jgi:hypothetical protein
MNKALLTGNIVLLGIVVVMSGFLWGPSHGKILAPPPADYKSCYECGKDTFYGLTLEEFMLDIARYKTTHARRIDSVAYMDNHNLRDTRACWYSLDTLEKYICLIKKYSQQENLTSSELGIRFYYAVYPSDPQEVWNGKYISRHTLFMVPTRAEWNKDKGQYDNIDFDPRLGAAPLAGYFSGSTKTRVMVLDLGRPELSSELAKNQGQLCPPNCPPGTVNTLEAIDKTYPVVKYAQ